ncbi:MAG: glycosyltransferase family 2 protein, partial [Rhodospirillaceae bacterium]|nr:glycosyltransferase family 2 protein [Rhodospirillaceae bacterium]
MDTGWTIVVPFFNEERFIGATLRSLAAQTLRPRRIVLVDNASNDASVAVAHDALASAFDVEVVWQHEPRPGQVHALACGLSAVNSAFVAICDADTIYPPHYLQAAQRVFDRGGPVVVAVLAAGIAAPVHGLRARLKRLKTLLVGRLLAAQCHAGGYGHCFRTVALRDAGGYGAHHWPFVL